MTWLPGLELARRFYHEAVQPIIAAHFPALPYTAALLGSGSEVLGFDTPVSADHHWGPRVMLFTSEADRHLWPAINTTLATHLPAEIAGFSTHYSSPDPTDNGVQHLQPHTAGPINHRAELFTVGGFLGDYLGHSIDTAWSASHWLSVPSQRLRAVTVGAVFRDDDGQLSQMRAQLAFYPREVWLYLLAAGWQSIAEDEHLMPRAGQVGDVVGARVITARLVRTAMQLCFLMERVYAPYHKWFGTAFKQLDCADNMLPLFEAALTAPDWETSMHALARVYEGLATLHNQLGVTAPLATSARQFWGRPFLVSDGGRFAQALLGAITDDAVRGIAQRTRIGNIDQFSANTILLEDTRQYRRVMRLYVDED